MPKYKLAHLGSCIRAARHDCKLTQQELADDCHAAIKTIQNIEKGQMNPSFEILYPIVNRLGISANILFNPDSTEDEEEIQHLIGKFQVCNSEDRKFMLNTVDCMVEQLLARQSGSETKDSE
ncbi:helix-turn-helix transcriptional regulator [uncultured Phocaeicola sp.]|uniref:helix-turn-helix domain-containing protein n=1 Tax=uncultured Phocaeicola sp. TaxID=990718 RepID=UPI0025A27C69|nr:helix-turn-helix transcriptional regulator [uncultured Phocaeicola sp.]